MTVPADNQTPRPRLLFVVTEDWYFVSHRLRLAQAAAAAGYRVCVATRVGREAAILAASGLDVIPLTHMLRTSRNPWRELAAILELRRIYRACHPDVVHLVAMKPVIYGNLAARIAKVPAIVNALAGLGFVFASASSKAGVLRPLVRLLLRFVLGTANGRTILQNPDDVAALVGGGLLPAERVRLIRGAGVDLHRFDVRPEPTGRPLVILAARLLWDKGVGDFVALARTLRGTGVDARFALVGESDPGNPAAVPEEQVAAWQAAGDVEYWGRHDDMPGVFSQSAIVCLPSTYGEGVPKVLIEAAACARPIVAYDMPGCREIVRDGHNGLLVPPGDLVALATAVRHLLDDGELRVTMGRAGRAMAEREFSDDLVIARTLEVYGELAGRGAVA